MNLTHFKGFLDTISSLQELCGDNWLTRENHNQVFFYPGAPKGFQGCLPIIDSKPESVDNKFLVKLYDMYTKPYRLLNHSMQSTIHYSSDRRDVWVCDRDLDYGISSNKSIKLLSSMFHEHSPGMKDTYIFGTGSENLLYIKNHSLSGTYSALRGHSMHLIDNFEWFFRYGVDGTFMEFNSKNPQNILCLEADDREFVFEQCLSVAKETKTKPERYPEWLQNYLLIG